MNKLQEYINERDKDKPRTLLEILEEPHKTWEEIEQERKESYRRAEDEKVKDINLDNWIKQRREEIQNDVDELVINNIGLKYKQAILPQEFIDYADNLVSKLSDLSSLKGLFITGSVGSGKTYCMAAMIRYMFIKQYDLTVEKHRQIDQRKYDFIHNIHTEIERPIRLKWYSMTDFYLQLKAYFGKPGSEQNKLIEDCKTIDLLFLDDLGAEKASEWATGILYNIIDYRNRNMKPTFITSNLSIADISNIYGERIASRIVEMCEVIYITGEDRRL
jgi:DNA replication protein DnaC